MWSSVARTISDVCGAVPYAQQLAEWLEQQEALEPPANKAKFRASVLLCANPTFTIGPRQLGVVLDMFSKGAWSSAVADVRHLVLGDLVLPCWVNGGLSQQLPLHMFPEPSTWGRPRMGKIPGLFSDRLSQQRIDAALNATVEASREADRADYESLTVFCRFASKGAAVRENDFLMARNALHEIHSLVETTQTETSKSVKGDAWYPLFQGAVAAAANQLSQADAPWVPESSEVTSLLRLQQAEEGPPTEAIDAIRRGGSPHEWFLGDKATDRVLVQHRAGASVEKWFVDRRRSERNFGVCWVPAEPKARAETWNVMTRHDPAELKLDLMTTRRFAKRWVGYWMKAGMPVAYLAQDNRAAAR